MEDYRVTQTGDEIQEIFNQSPVDTADIAELKEAATSLDGRLEAVEGKIPSGASSENPLTDKQYVDSSIASASATFRGTYNEVTDLELTTEATHAEIGEALASVIDTADSNDYCFVQIPTADATPTEIESIERYKFVTGTGWQYEYTLNNSGFTADQWAAINSGITSGLVAKLTDLPTNAELNTLLNGKANAADVYTKSETYNKTELDTQLGAKANSADVYEKSQTYTKQEVDALITTPEVQYVTVTATAGTTSVTDVLPATGAPDTIYRVGSWDGMQYATGVYSEYAWNGITYILLDVKNYGFATGSDFNNPTTAQRELVTTVGSVLDGISEGVFDLTAKTGDSYATLADALTAANTSIPTNKKKGGMSIKYVQTSDNKYVQYRYMSSSTAIADFTNVVNWQGVEDVPVAGSDNLVKSSGVFNKTNSIESNVAAITGDPGDIPFVVGTVSGMISGTQLAYLDTDNRLRVEMASDKIHTIQAKNGYEFSICAFEDKIPTAKKKRLHVAGYITSINVQTSISSITDFNPNRIVLSIKNTEGTPMTGINSLDEVIDVTFVDTTINDLKFSLNYVEDVVNKNIKAVYIKGSHSYTTNSITFGQGSTLAIKKVQQGSLITITFDTETTYTLNATSRSLIFDGEVVSTSRNDNIKETDVLLLIWSDTFIGGALYNDYQDYIYNTLKTVFTTGEVIYKNGGILFKAGSSLYYKDYDTGANKHIDFADDTEYSATQYSSLVLRDNSIIQINPPDYRYNDVVLGFWRTNGIIVSGALFPEYICKSVPNKLTDIPFKLGSFTGVSSNYIEYYDSASRISVELDTKNISTIKTKSGYAISAACLFEDSIPTSDFASITVNNNTVYINEEIGQEYTFNPNKVILSIKKSNNADFDIGLSSVEDIIDICFASLPADKGIIVQRNVIKCGVVRGALNATGYYPTTSGIVNGYAHTPTFINIKDSMCTIKNTEILSGYIFYYDKNKDYVKKVGINTLVGGVVPRYVNTEYIRFSFNTTTNNSVLPYNGIYLEGTWDDINKVEEYSNIPSDSGYTNMVFPVRINTNATPSASVSSITEQYTYSENCGVLHLPASYSPVGKGTPLIIYLHGAQDRYTPADKRFKVRFAQEWDAAGYAQMDVDMIPSLYNFTQSGYAGTGDDLVCVEAAYNWAIEHYNIRRDGIYLFGRSRGGMAVLSILGKYNPVKLPIICALSNTGANSMLLYALFRDSVTTNWWNAFCTSTGLLNPPAIATNTPIVAQPTVASFLRDNIDKWWYKAMVALPMIVDNPTVYQTPEQIFDLLVSSYSDTDKGKTFSENFVEQCKFRSPVPLRFDWCVGDTAQRWDIPWFYGLAGKNAFVNSKLVGNSVYREWPECTGGEPHYHEDYNIYNGDYTLPNGSVVTNPSMAQVEWLLWAQSHDNRDL